MKFLKQEYGHVLLRISLGIVFLWFGISQLYAPANWIGFVPEFMASLYSAQVLVILNGSLEVFLGLMMISGVYVRVASLILGIHLTMIGVSMGYTATAVRDIGLGLATLAIMFIGPDRFCYHAKNVEEAAKEQSHE